MSDKPERVVWYVTGLDLGQLSDYSALVAVEVVWDPGVGPDPVFNVRHLKRWPLQTKYPVIVEDVKSLFAVGPLAGSMLVIDRTGVGVAVADMVAQAEVNANVSAYCITCGLQSGEGTVPKADLVGAVQVALQNERLKIAPGLKLADTLGKELEEFRVKVTADRNETFASWRERSHDDLVLALALAVWKGKDGYCGPDAYGADYGAAERAAREMPPGVFGRGGSYPGWR